MFLLLINERVIGYYDLKPLCFQPLKLLFPRIFEINAIRLYKAERIKMDLSLRCDFAV